MSPTFREVHEAQLAVSFQPCCNRTAARRHRASGVRVAEIRLSQLIAYCWFRRARKQRQLAVWQLSCLLYQRFLEFEAQARHANFHSLNLVCLESRSHYAKIENALCLVDHEILGQASAASYKVPGDNPTRRKTPQMFDQADSKQ